MPRRTFFLSKWFHNELLTSEEPFCFTKGFFVAKEGSSDYKKVRKRWFFKEPLNEWFFVEPILCEEPFKHLYFEECMILALLTWFDLIFKM